MDEVFHQQSASAASGRRGVLSGRRRWGPPTCVTVENLGGLAAYKGA